MDWAWSSIGSAAPRAFGGRPRPSAPASNSLFQFLKSSRPPAPLKDAGRRPTRANFCEWVKSTASPFGARLRPRPPPQPSGLLASAAASPRPRPPPSTLQVRDRASPPTFGANLPYTEVEAEGPTVTTTGTLVGPSYTFTTLAAEASGRKAISLAPGQSLDLPAPTTTNALTIRYSIPDSATGGGLDTPLMLLVDMGFVQNVTLTSNFSYFYGAYPFTKNPSDGLPHHYFNEVDVMLPSTVAQGAIIRLLNPDVVSVVGGGDECGVVPHNPLRDCGFNGINSSQCLDRKCCWKPVTPNPNHIPC